MEILCLRYGGLQELGPAEINNLYKLTTPSPGEYQRILDNLTNFTVLLKAKRRDHELTTLKST